MRSSAYPKMFCRKEIKYITITSILYIVLAFIVLISVFPLVWMLVSSFKQELEIFGAVFHFFPQNITMQAYSTLFAEEAGFLQSMYTTFLGAVLSTFGCLIVNSLAAYAFARTEFLGKSALWVLMIIPMFIPGIATLIPLYLVVSQLGLLDNMAGLILPGIAQAGWIFFLRQFFLNMPKSLEEAAFVDGAGRVRILFLIFLPISAAPLIIVGVGAFVGYWNAYMWPAMVITNNENIMQIMQVINQFRTSNNVQWTVIMAGSTIAALVPFLLFMVFQKYILEGIKISGIK